MIRAAARLWEAEYPQGPGLQEERGLEPAALAIPATSSTSGTDQSPLLVVIMQP